MSGGVVDFLKGGCSRGRIGWVVGGRARRWGARWGGVVGARTAPACPRPRLTPARRSIGGGVLRGGGSAARAGGGVRRGTHALAALNPLMVSASSRSGEALGAELAQRWVFWCGMARAGRLSP